MALSDIRTRLKTLLETVADVGVVHDYERWAAEWSKVLETFKVAIGGQERIQAWTITREATPVADHETTTELSTHLMVLRFYRGLDDTVGSEKAFQDKIEDVRAAIRAERNIAPPLGGFVSRLGPAQVRIVEHRQLGGVLCHYAEMTVEAAVVES